MPNQAPNPSFEIDLSDWESASGTPSTLTRVTSGTHFHGIASMAVTANAAAANVTVRTPESGTLGPAVAPGDVWSIGVHGLWVTGTPKNIRADLRWMTNATTESATQPGLGSSVAMNTSTYVQSVSENATAPADAVSLRIRLVVVSAALSDVFRIDGIQMEKAASLPAFDDGSPSGWGTRGYEITVGG